MAKTSAKEIFSSPTAQAVGATVLGGPVGGLLAAGGIAGAGAAKEQDERLSSALEQAKNLETTTSRDTSAKVSNVDKSKQVSQTSFDKASKEEKALQDASIKNFQKQQNLVDAGEADIKARSGLQNEARDTLGSVVSGDAFDLTSGENARIDALRNANIAVGANATDKMLNDRLAAISADAARRGVRGQAFSQLQTGALAAGAESLDRNTLEANRIAAEQAIQLPGQRATLQASTAGGLADFSEQARQQAIANRASLQDPVALQQMRDERLAGGKTITQSNNRNTQTNTTSDKSVGTGVGAAEILRDQANAPGPKAAGTAGVLGVAELGVKALPAIAGL